MKNFLLLLMFLSNSCFAADDKLSLSQSDRQLHFMLSAQGSTIISLLAADDKNKLKGPLIGFIAMTTIGIAKEIVHDDHVSIGDIKADILGSLTGSLLVFTVKSF